MKKGSFPYDRKSYRRFPKRRKDAAIIETFDEPPFLKTLIAPQLRERVYQNIIKRLLKPINFSSLFSLLSGVFANPTVTANQTQPQQMKEPRKNILGS